MTTNQAALPGHTFVNQTNEEQAVLPIPRGLNVNRNPAFISQRSVQPHIYAASTLQNFSWWVVT